MLKYLLDANIVIYVIKRRPAAVREVFNRQHSRMALSAVTLAELLHGVEKSSDPPRNLTVVEEFCSRLTVLPYSAKAARCTTATSAPFSQARVDPWGSTTSTSLLMRAAKD